MMMARSLKSLLLAACWFGGRADQQAPQPVESLDLAAFAGRWYQTYGSLSVKYATELGANCVYVEYGAVANSSAVSVTNSVSILGMRVDVHGFAVPNPQRTGEFEVALGPPGHGPASPTPFKHTNYVVIALGPVVAGLYDYAVVTDPSLLSLYVLTRDVARFSELHEADVLQLVEKQGFTNMLNKPRKTNQQGCKYPNELAVIV
eukprot:TRINITY_DN22632_c0_g1_i1.p1 TRINITY_DN22632_c0_g1~~TRINITY_DN22632_c0_g1_i1.p1  ORF type:complete len:204 (+),score=27.62 TRINITY_DN22632_c0_g1_i1:82-693(+)